MPRADKGLSLLEAVVTVFVVSLAAMVLGNTITSLMKMQVKSGAMADLQTDYLRVVQELGLTLGKAGDGVVNCPVGGKQVFAFAPHVDISSITFLSEDRGCVSGLIDSKDRWKRYLLENGKVMEEVWETDSSNKIPAQYLVPAAVSGAVLTSSGVVTDISHGARVSKLEFSYYTSVMGQQTLDSFSASVVKIHLELQKAGVTLKRDDWINLRNVANGPTNVPVCTPAPCP